MAVNDNYVYNRSVIWMVNVMWKQFIEDIVNGLAMYGYAYTGMYYVTESTLGPRDVAAE